MTYAETILNRIALTRTHETRVESWDTVIVVGPRRGMTEAAAEALGVEPSEIVWTSRVADLGPDTYRCGVVDVFAEFDTFDAQVSK